MNSHDHSPSIIKLNIGGHKFWTTTDTLTLRSPDSMLASMFSGRYNVNSQMSDKGYIFIDRDGHHFRHVLNWLRDGVIPNMNYHEYMELLREAEYFQIAGLIGEVKAKAAGLVDGSKAADCDPDLTRTDIIKYIVCHENPRLDGVNLSGVDLSGLYLSRASLIRANLKGANLKGTNLEGANLDGANLEGANLTKANLRLACLRRVNVEGAILDSKGMAQLRDWGCARDTT